jgi:protein-tyrosine phosphatase
VIDLHTHVLPGIDDGAKSLEDSMNMARMAADDGITTLVATPHAWWGGEANGGTVIRGAVGEVMRELEKLGIPVQVVPGSEVPMRPNLLDIVQAEPTWTYAGQGKYLLLEPPWGPVPAYAPDLVRAFIDVGITPIIAHPERNPDIQAHVDVLDRLMKAGALTQITGHSLTGRHGSEARSAAFLFLETNRVDVVSSDAHNARNRSPILSPARTEVENMLGSTVAQRLFQENPQRILDGEQVVDRSVAGACSDEPPGPLARLWQRLRGA